MSSPRLSRRAFTLACASAALAACTSTGTKPTTGAATPANPTQPREKPIRVGVALGGGAARGFAHVGVLKALEARGIPVELVAGTSAGSVVGALYASGMNALQINKLALTMDEASISDWATPFRSRGLLQGIALQNFINKTLNNRPIEKMAKPLGIVATDLKSGQPILFQRGNTGLAVRASCSVPSVFEPVRIGDREYVDGGLVSPVPASFARKMGADFVIAVDISSRPDGAATGNPIEMLLQTFTIMGQTIKTYELDKYADVVIRPNLAAMGGSDFKSAQRGDPRGRGGGRADHAGAAAQARGRALGDRGRLKPARVAPPPAARLGTRARSRSYRAAPKTPPQSKSPASMGARGFDTGIGRRDAA
ncbi:patatin-like phospholipase family protein [Burkholderia pseudomallei MSHR449]|nr:patatin-like phospholipase family protein [Burkholderia pseudomallei MSHR449]